MFFFLFSLICSKKLHLRFNIKGKENCLTKNGCSSESILKILDNDDYIIVLDKDIKEKSVELLLNLIESASDKNVSFVGSETVIDFPKTITKRIALKLKNSNLEFTGFTFKSSTIPLIYATDSKLYFMNCKFNENEVNSNNAFSFDRCKVFFSNTKFKNNKFSNFIFFKSDSSQIILEETTFKSTNKQFDDKNYFEFYNSTVEIYDFKMHSMNISANLFKFKDCRNVIIDDANFTSNTFKTMINLINSVLSLTNIDFTKVDGSIVYCTHDSTISLFKINFNRQISSSELFIVKNSNLNITDLQIMNSNIHSFINFADSTKKYLCEISNLSIIDSEIQSMMIKHNGGLPIVKYFKIRDTKLISGQMYYIFNADEIHFSYFDVSFVSTGAYATPAILISNSTNIFINQMNFDTNDLFPFHFDKDVEIKFDNSTFNMNFFVADSNTKIPQSILLFSDTYNISTINNTFTDNFAPDGAVYARYSEMLVHNSTFIRNEAIFGSSVNAKNATIYVINGNFYNNVGLVGGGVSYLFGSCALYNNCTFVANSGGNEGGVILAESNDDMALNKCKSRLNTAKAATFIFARDSEMLIQRVEVDDEFEKAMFCNLDIEQKENKFGCKTQCKEPSESDWKQLEDSGKVQNELHSKKEATTPIANFESPVILHKYVDINKKEDSNNNYFALFLVLLPFLIILFLFCYIRKIGIRRIAIIMRKAYGKASHNI